MAALLVIFADVVADQIKHISGQFTSIFVNNNDFIGNKLPMLLPIIPPGANPSEAATLICDLRLPIGKPDNKEQTP